MFVTDRLWIYRKTVFIDTIWGGVGRSLARPWRKQATATKLGIIQHTLHRARCTSWPVATQKNSESFPSNQVSTAAMTPASDQKWRPFNCFSVQKTGGSLTGPDPENRVDDQDIGSPVRPVSSELQVPGEPGHCSERTTLPWRPSRRVFPFKMSFNCTTRDE